MHFAEMGQRKLRKRTSQSGIVYQSALILQAINNLHKPGGLYFDVGERVAPGNLHAGDFFKEIPTYKYYCIKWCLQDWNDAEVVEILTSMRKAIIRGPKSRLVLLEMVLREGRSGHLSRMADMSVVIAASGKERDELEWHSLAQQISTSCSSTVLPTSGSADTAALAF